MVFMKKTRPYRAGLGMEVDCLLRPLFLCRIGLLSLFSAFLSGLRCVLESRRREYDAESGLKESLRAFRPKNIDRGLKFDTLKYNDLL